MRRILFFSVILLVLGATAYGQLTSYSIIGQVANDAWSRTDDAGDFDIGTTATGIQIGRMADDGFDLDWAGSMLIPLSFRFERESDSESATIADANFGFGFAGHVGAGYGLKLSDRFIVTPALAWHTVFSSYSFDFPGGAREYRELTHGPAAVAQAAFQLTDDLWLQGGALYGYSPFHFGGVSNSGSDDVFEQGTAMRGWLGVRLPSGFFRSSL